MTPAGTTISNVARIGFRFHGAPALRNSNRVDLRVGEIIDFSVTPAPLCSGPALPGGVIAVGFRITNLGNGREAFIPGKPAVTDGSSFVPSAVVADSNGNGCYDPDVDVPIAPGRATPAVASGGSIIIFVVGTGGNGVGRVLLPITSETGGGVTGTNFPGAGDDGGDAVIGMSGGTTGDVTLPIPGGLRASLVKSQSVRAPNGSATPRSGAVVTYTIEGRFAGIGIATNAAIADAIPAGTAYVVGSLKLDGRVLSDRADGDAGQFDGARVDVRLGDVAAPAVRTVSFQVQIK